MKNDSDFPFFILAFLIIGFILGCGLTGIYLSVKSDLKEQGESVSKCEIDCQKFRMVKTKEFYDFGLHCWCFDSFDRQVKQLY